MNTSKILSGLVGVVMLLLAPASALAQTYEQVAPKTLPPSPPPALPPPPATAPAAPSDDQVLLPALKGLVFITDKSALQVQGLSTPGVSLGGDPLLNTAELRKIATAYIGRPVTIRLLDAITRDVVLYCRRHDRPVVDVFVPQQNINAGTVQILVLQGRVGQVRVEGNRWFATRLIRGPIRAKPGDIIVGSELLDDLAWINQNPFRQVDLVYARGENPGETDIILRTQDRLPLRVYATYDNSGNDLTGNDRVGAGINWGDVFGTDQQLNYQITASPDFKEMVANSASYVIPIEALRDTLTFFGSYATSEPQLPGGYFILKGRNSQASFRYKMPLPSVGQFTQDFTVGADFKRSNNNLAFGGAQIFAQSNDVVQGIMVYDANLPDKFGTTNAEVTMAISPGGLSSGDHTTPYQEARAGAVPDYQYALAQLVRDTKLPEGFSWIVRATGQASTENLLPSEQLGFGGYASLRGFDEREVNADNGLILSNELHGPAFSLLRIFGGAGIDRLDPLIFWDYGIAADCKLLPGEPGHTDLSSIGAGLRYNMATNVTARIDYGWEMIKDDSAAIVPGHHKLHAGVVVSY